MENFICSFFGKYTLEKYEKNRIEVLAKEKNSFLNDIEAVESLEALRDLIKNRLTEEQKNFFSTELQDKKADVRKIRRNKSLKIALVVGVIALYGGTVFLMKVNEKKQVTATQQSAETEITILNKIIDNDSENIEEDMQKLNYPKKKQVDIYVKLGDYTKAYELDKKSDKKLFKVCTNKGKPKK
ncbi:hypothetical protein [Enterococcus casseliflavus]|uniref:hypothetical protein n=1 Tax=Enterococcus casseliflavus TaxID=37734 RepID=UPI001F356848|nr:hypothetical protein [Enterococcus casseliflavus]